MRGSNHDFGSDLRGQQAVADWFVRRYGPPRDEGRNNGHGHTRAVYEVPDEVIIDRIRASQQREKFARLYDWADASEYGGDESGADFGLLGILKGYTQDPEQLERLMVGSALKRDKWTTHRPLGGTYLRHSIREALKQVPWRHEWPDEYLSLHREGVGSDGGEKEEPSDFRDRFVRPAEIVAAATTADPWVCRPWLARGGITDLAGTAKLSGKTTFMLHMAAAILRGSYFMGNKCHRSPVVFLSEQGNNIEKALRSAGVTRHQDLYIMLRHLGHGLTWPQTMRAALLMCADVGADVLMVDTLNRFAGLVGEQENQAGPVSEAMTPLLDAARKEGLAVMVSRHANHDGRGRGSTQFLHDVDIVLTMRQPDGAMPATTRRLEGHGRYDHIPPVTNIELADGRYVDLGSSPHVRRERAKAAAKAFISEHARDDKEPPTKAEIVAHVEGPNATKSTTVDRALDELVDDGEIVRVGRGVKGDPYRYGFFLPTGGGRPPVGGEKGSGEVPEAAQEEQEPPGDEARAPWKGPREKPYDPGPDQTTFEDLDVEEF